ncbi:MAG: hypothetical protein ABI945_05790, partial [Nitrospirales bacterium]
MPRGWEASKEDLRRVDALLSGDEGVFASLLEQYLDSLQAPAGAKVDPTAAAHGRELFRAKCTTCHNVDQSKFVPPMLVDLKTLWPAYNPTVLAKRTAPLDAIQDSPGIFDEKMIVVDASIR